MAGSTEQSKVLTLVFTDLADSTALKTERGDQAVGDMISQHRGHVTRLAEKTSGRIVDWAGDGCFLAFDTPSAGVDFGLRLQQIHAGDADLPRVRVGVHMGEVTVREQPDATQRVEGLAVDLASRIESLAIPGQLLMSSTVFDSARQRLRADDKGSPIAWRAHGEYEFKGFDDPLDICEAGFEATSPLEAPTGSEKAHRAVTPAEEDTLGWRPAIGLTVPLRDNWVLEGQLGEGGFGEVWLARHTKTTAKRVFKFCFEGDRVRGLKREVVLFRLLRESLGDRDDIAQILDWEFEKPPFFLEAEYTEGGDLKDWAKEQGGISTVPIETRLDLVAQTAVALGAAHSVGVLHKDIKPANILVRNSAETGAARTRLTDFGIGRITDAQALIDHGITSAGMTDTLVGGTSSSGSGTRLYMAPEVIEGKPPTTLSDIYSLGVVLYQVAIGDLTRGVATGWERDIDDDLLREDIALCVDGSPGRRITSAAEIAERIRSLPQRHAKIEEEHRVREEAKRVTEIREKARKRRKQFIVATSFGIALTLLIALAAFRENRRADEQSSLRTEAEALRSEEALSREDAEAARVLAETATAEAIAAQQRAEDGQYIASIQVAAVRLDNDESVTARAALLTTQPTNRGWEWGYLVNQAWPELGNASGEERAAGKSSAETWSASTPSVVHELPSAGGAIIRADYSLDGRFISTSNFDGTARIWDASSGELIKEVGERGGFPVYIALYSPSNQRLVTNTDGGSLWDTESNRLIKRLSAVSLPNQMSGSFSHDETRFALAYADYTTRIFETSSGNLISELAGHTAPVLETFFSKDQQRLFTSGSDGTVREWEVDSGELLRTVHAPFPSPAIVSSNLRQAATYGDAAVNLWELESGEITVKIPYTTTGTIGINFSPDGSVMRIGSVDDGIIQLFDTESGTPLASYSLGTVSPTNGNFSPDGNRLVQPAMDGVARVLAPLDSRPDAKSDELSHDSLVGFVDYSPDGRYMATASYDKTVKVWDVESGALLSTLTGNTAPVNGVSFSPDGKRVISRAVDGAHRIWEWETARELGSHEPNPDPFLADVERTGGIYAGPTLSLFGNLSLSISPDGSRFAARTDSGLGIIDATSGRILASLEGVEASEESPLTRLEFSPNGELIAIGRVNILNIFNAKTGRQVHVLDAHTDLISFFEFSKDGTKLVTASLDGTAKVWAVDSGAELLTLTGHQAFIIDARFNKAADRVLTASADNTAKLWDATTGEELVTFTGHSVFLLGADFSPDETRILTYARDNTAKLWDLDGRELVTLGGEFDITHAAWSPDGSQISTAWRDGRVRTFNAISWEEMAMIGDDEMPFEERLSILRDSLAP